MIFHFWQQTWIFPVINTPWLSFIKIGGKALTRIDFSPFAMVGYLFVDMMVLLSGFLLSLPLVRCILKNEPLDSTRKYFKKRLTRILPSYLFAVLAIFVYEMINGGYDLNGAINTKLVLRDLITHLTFTHMMRVDTYLGTKLDVVLWTLAVEVWFYILFPLICRIINGSRRKQADAAPAYIKVIRLLFIAFIMVGISHIYIYKYALASGSGFANKVDSVLKALGSTIRSSYLSMTINQLPAFMGVYAVGLVGALIYVFAANHMERSKTLSIFSTIAAFMFIWLIVYMVKDCSHNSGEAAQTWQIEQRLKLAIVFMGFILTSAFSARWFRFIFSNRLMRFLSGISYNLYIWHQWLAVKIKNDWRIPAWEGETPPNQLGTEFGKSWSAKYAVVITVAAFAAAILATYLVEKPFADLLNGRPSIYNGKLKKASARSGDKADAPTKKTARGN